MYITVKGNIIPLLKKNNRKLFNNRTIKRKSYSLSIFINTNEVKIKNKNKYTKTDFNCCDFMYKSAKCYYHNLLMSNQHQTFFFSKTLISRTKKIRYVRRQRKKCDFFAVRYFHNNKINVGKEISLCVPVDQMKTWRFWQQTKAHSSVPTATSFRLKIRWPL